MPISPHNPIEKDAQSQDEEKVLYTSTEVEGIVQERVAGLQQELADLKKADNERKRVKEALRESEEKCRSLMVPPPQTLVILQDGRIVFANLWAEEYGGYSEEELLAMSDEEVLQLFHSEDRPMIARCIRGRLVRTDEPVRREVRFIRRDGEVLYGDVFVNLVQYRGREAYQILFVDITERKRVEEALRESQAALEKAQKMAHIGNWTWDLRTNRTVVSRELARVYGIDTDSTEVDNSVFLNSTHPEDRRMVEEAVLRAIAEHTPLSVDCRIIRPDGEVRFIHSEGEVVLDGQGCPIQVFGTDQDITDRKQAEAALQEYAENLRRRNEDLDRYAYVASHDLKEPLRAIVSFSQILQQEYTGRLDASADRYLDNIAEAGNRMNTLINDLLEFSRVTVVRTEYHPVDPAVVVKDALSLLQAETDEHGVTITSDPLPMVMGDPNQLQQVFLNLISNAIKFRKPGVPPEIHISAQKLDDMVQFSVQDNGIGIEPEYYDRIFMIFERLHGREKYPGTGIGLAIVKRIIDQHDGKIWVESEPGKGSTFYFTIPAA